MKNKIKQVIHILFRSENPPEPVVAMIFNDEKKFLETLKQVTHVKGLDTITPYPVHGVEEILKIKRSWLPWVTFIFGLLGLSFGLWFTWWTSSVSWPLNIGGKPYFSLPAFIPIAFECTILFSALTTVASLFYACGLPKIDPPVLDLNLTSHTFAIYAPVSQNELEVIKDEWKKYSSNIIVENF